MTFPASLTQVTVHATFVTQAGDPARGTVTFTAPYPLLGPVDDVIVAPFSVTETMDASGAVTVELPSTNDPQWTPAGWLYRVEVKADGETFTGLLALDHATASVELSDLLQVSGTAEPGVTYLLATQRSVAGGVAGLDADGDVINAAGAKITGGGGGGSGYSKRVASGYVTSGDLTPQDTGGGWALLSGGPTFSVACTTGDLVTLSWNGLIDPVSSLGLDNCVIASGAPALYAATGTASPAIEGNPGMYQDNVNFQPHPGLFTFVAQAGHISGGQVTLGFAVKASGAGKLYAGAAFPLAWTLTSETLA